MANVNNAVLQTLNDLAERLEAVLEADLLAIDSPIAMNLDITVRKALESFPNKRKRLAILISTLGGYVEVAERIVTTIRHHYPDDVHFIIADRAMSAGTILVMSGNEIWMNYFSCLGPIDPQVFKNERWVPALSYLAQYERLKALGNKLTNADMILLNQLDLAELYKYEQAREMSSYLLKEWLTKYKFKNWTKTDGRKRSVTKQMKIQRAKEIATKLSKVETWFSHSRGISMEVLTRDVGLIIRDFGKNQSLSNLIEEYASLVGDYRGKHTQGSFVHTRCFH
jgi:membrane-bound ClpP family serine protease